MSSRSQKIISVALTVLALTGSFKLAMSLNGMREDFELVRMELPSQARADLLTNVLLSVGRALAVDYLWIGLQNMQQEGRYFDANQRAEWICQLQPHFPAVWIFQAWNMSYNISVAMTSGEDRWRWVRNGYELLRDKGIPLNPKSISMYQQLAWIFHHKIGALSDDQHWYYKRQIAESIGPIVGWPDEKYDIMAEAPDTWAKLLKLPNMKEFLAGFEAFKLDPKETFLDILTHRDTYGEKVVAWVDDPKYAQCRRMLEGHLRAAWLKREWKLDIKTIAELRADDMYGPLDFRTAHAHAIYWAYTAFKVAGHDLSFDALSADRVIYGSLQDLVRRGRLYLPEEKDAFPLLTPDIRFIPVAHRAYVLLGTQYGDPEKFQSGHVNFLRKVIALYYQYGRTDMARKYWKIMTETYPLKEYDVGMERYVRKIILEDIESLGMPDANASVQLMLMEAYRQYALGEDYSALAMEKVAKRVYDAYNKGREWRGGGETGRVSLRPWKEIVARTRQLALQAMPPSLAERLRQRLGIDTQGPEPEPKQP